MDENPGRRRRPCPSAGRPSEADQARAAEATSLDLGELLTPHRDLIAALGILGGDGVRKGRTESAALKLVAPDVAIALTPAERPTPFSASRCAVSSSVASCCLFP